MQGKKVLHFVCDLGPGSSSFCRSTKLFHSDLLRWNTFLAENPGRKYPALQRVMAMILGGRALRELANSVGARTAL